MREQIENILTDEIHREDDNLYGIERSSEKLEILFLEKQIELLSKVPYWSNTAIAFEKLELQSQLTELKNK